MKSLLFLRFIRGGSRAAATSKMERFVITVNGWKPLFIVAFLFFIQLGESIYDPPQLKPILWHYKKSAKSKRKSLRFIDSSKSIWYLNWSDSKSNFIYHHLFLYQSWFLCHHSLNYRFFVRVFRRHNVNCYR